MWSALCVGFLPIVAISLAGVDSLEQPKEMTVQEGKPVNIPCTMKRDSMRFYSMSWYRQGPSGTQEWIYNEDGTYGEGFKGRFKIKDLKYSNKFPLQILAAKQGDAATYYCRARSELRTWGAGSQTLNGPGTILTVIPKVTVEKSTKSEDVGTTGKTTPLPTVFHTKNISLETSSKEQNTSALTTQLICTDRFDSSAITILPDMRNEGKRNPEKRSKEREPAAQGP